MDIPEAALSSDLLPHPQPSPSRRSSFIQPREEFHSQFSEEDFQRELEQAGPRVTGPGGVRLPHATELGTLLDQGPDSVSVMCFTWNIAGKAGRSLPRLNSLFAKMAPHERPSLIALALQELPPSTLKFHSAVLQSLGQSLSSSHRVFCWVRKWSQMLILFIRHRLSLFTSHPEYRFVAGSKMARPFRTKGAIGIRFRLLQAQCIFVACHLTHGKVERRILDYRKIAEQFDFDSITKSEGIHAHCFWFGDLNFRVLKKEELADVAENMQKRLFRRQADFKRILAHDELGMEREKGLFKGFREAVIKFPPTHKFRLGTSLYLQSRMPSYTDRVLFRSDSDQSLTAIRYDCVWDANCSDHKPVYCTFRMKMVLRGRREAGGSQEEEERRANGLAHDKPVCI